MKENLLGEYKNGNYNVKIYSNGTKIRETEDNEFIAEFPENIDVKITNYCKNNCKFCHEGSNDKGRHGNILNLKFFDSLKPFTELAIGGGNCLSHPDLEVLLYKLKEKQIIPNLTLHQKDFLSNIEKIKEWVNKKLIYGIGVSLNKVTDELVTQIYQFKNMVIHTINGVVTIEQLNQLPKEAKILILGYKQLRNGTTFYNNNKNILKYNQQDLFFNLMKFIDKFKVLSFDNLAIQQLNVRKFLSEEQWNEFYMGDDGQHTMYIDCVEEQFALNSTANFNERYKLKDNIIDMFKVVKNN